MDPKTELKTVLGDRKSELTKALAGLKLPEEMEAYLEVSKALKAYGVDSPEVPKEQQKVRPIDWNIISSLKPGTKVQVVTTQGEIVFELYPDRAPATVSSFIQLTRDGYFNGKSFHRVVPNFVVQTGCPRGDGYGSLDFTLRSELAGSYYDDEGYVGMASAGLHTEGTQFFITHSPTPHLDGRYTIFGKVTSGMEIVHRISMGDLIKQINILNN
jgi:cyclophilin family peptidyl-prolyl cis-trans isomerase